MPSESGAGNIPGRKSGQARKADIDVAVLPLRTGRRASRRQTYDEDFVVACERAIDLHVADHRAFCAAHHLLVSLSGDPRGFVDDLLAQRGLKRRIALTVPTFHDGPLRTSQAPI